MLADRHYSLLLINRSPRLLWRPLPSICAISPFYHQLTQFPLALEVFICTERPKSEGDGCMRAVPYVRRVSDSMSGTLTPTPMRATRCIYVSGLDHQWRRQVVEVGGG